MENMGIYNAVRAVPDNAKKPISAGRLRGMTDINPMWRIQALTNQFGPCGLGWKYVIKDKRMENGANGEIAAFVDIDLYYKVDGEWSEAVPGTGGASFHDEAAEAAEIDVVVLGQRRLDALHERLDDGLHLYLFGAGGLGDFAYDICFCHSLCY